MSTNTFPMKLLLAVDGLKGVTPTIRTAVDLAKKTGSELHVIHVGLLSRWTHPDTLSDAQYNKLKEEAQERLDRDVQQINDMDGTVTESYVRMGKVDGEIIKLSEELGADVIVVGNREQNTASRILLGNDAESIVRHAPCSVLVVRQED